MELAEQAEKLNRLVDENPQEAIRQALEPSGSIDIDMFKAAILVDAGGLLKDFESVIKGVRRTTGSNLAFCPAASLPEASLHSVPGQ